MLGVNKLATGHNADDMAETVLLNLLRGDIARSHSLSLHFIYFQDINQVITKKDLSQSQKRFVNEFESKF